MTAAHRVKISPLGVTLMSASNRAGADEYRWLLQLQCLLCDWKFYSLIFIYFLTSVKWAAVTVYHRNRRCWETLVWLKGFLSWREFLLVSIHWEVMLWVSLKCLRTLDCNRCYINKGGLDWLADHFPVFFFIFTDIYSGRPAPFPWAPLLPFEVDLWSCRAEPGDDLLLKCPALPPPPPLEFL